MKVIKRRINYKKIIINSLITIIVGILSLTMVVPFIWMLSASMKISADVMELPIRWIPKSFNLDNYKTVWHIGVEEGSKNYHFALSYWNSIKIALINLVGAVLTSTMAGYAFAKIKFKGSNLIFLIYLGTMMIPSQITIIPKYTMFSELGLLGTHWTLILPGIFTVTGTFLMRQAFLQVPDELRESAYIDGGSEFQIWARVMLPIVQTSMASLALLVFLWNWNNYLDALLFLTDWRLYTIPVALNNFIDETTTQYNLIMAASASALIPVFIVFLAGQKYFVKGLTAGAVKG